jgi:ribosome assembly protein YihI (activator of Der GTPase)
MHNLQIYDHKKLDRIRSILQKIGIKLDEFSILYDFMKFGKNLKLKWTWQNMEGTCKNARQFE